jgi:ribosomal-protein-alanine N-acetyltransferase
VRAELAQDPPTIDLASVRLRALRPEDAVAWHAYLRDPRVTELTSYDIGPLADVDAMVERCKRRYASGESCKWAIARQGGDDLIGTCGFNEWSRRDGWAELAYDLAPAYWGHGIVTQAVGACLAWAFGEAGFSRVHAFVMVGNARSERVLERAQFTREGCLRAYRISRGQARDFWVFSILRPEWEEQGRGRSRRA